MKYEKIILCTGSAGFIGSNFLRMMVPAHPEWMFVNFDLLAKGSNLKNIEEDIARSENYFFVRGDIRELQDIMYLYKQYPFTDIIHFAALTHVDDSIESPSFFVQTNVSGTHNLLTAARLVKPFGRFHFVSTDEVYGQLENIADDPFTESSLLNPRNPYSGSKAAAEMLVRSICGQYGIDYVITRSGNNYGPGQDKTKFIPKVIELALKGSDIPVYGEGKQFREWLHVSDHCRGIEKVFVDGGRGEIYNIGGVQRISNLALVKILLDLDGASSDSEILFVPDRLNHDFGYALDCKKINALGWAPKVKLSDEVRYLVKQLSPHNVEKVID